MKYSSYNFVFVAILAAAFFVSNFVTNNSLNAAPKKGGKLRIAILADIGGFDSLKIPITGRQRAFVMQAIHENLFDFDPYTSKIIPRLGLKAESFEDTKRWRITLRKGVKFSNGEELTATDYKAHIDRLLGSKFKARFVGALGPRLNRVEAPDKYIIDFIFSEPSPGWKTIMTVNNLLWWVRPKSYLEANKTKKTFNRNTVGVGPYMLKKWRRSSSIVLEKNPYYWDKENQHVDEIHFKIINKQISRYQSLQAGQSDYIWIPPFLSKRARKDQRLKVTTSVQWFGGLGIAFKHSVAPFNDLRVRKALLHALDRDKLNAVLKKGKGKAPNSMYPKGHPWECKNVKWPEYNPEKARALLKEYGKPIKFTLNMVGLKDLLRVAEAHQAYWKEVGVEVTIKPGPRGPQWGRAVQSGKFDVWWENYGDTTDPSLVGMIMHSKHKGNRYKIKNAKVDAAIANVKAARGRDARLKASCDFQQVIADQALFNIWEQGKVNLAYLPYVKNVIPANNIWPKYQRVWLDK
ncbi:MAG: ABC transporter substrate-binding protein [Rhodospirillales bacterium]|nr:ABC transporter substrate-binding protein [Rhodospirillales bacterium]MDC0989593.1 ABC transporter substrate-binding protein [Rhodospirillales bacterium]